MKNKIKEINLNVGHGLDSYPKISSPYHMGGPTMSADSHYSRNVMQRVNKNFNEEENEEIDKFVDELEDNSEKKEILEFIDPNLEKLVGIGKTGLMSIPVFGDAFAFTKFLFTVYKLKRMMKSFTKKLSKLTELDLGTNFLEAKDGGISENALDNNLAEATHRIANLKDYPQLDVTMVDIINLKSKFTMLCKYVKDAIQEFIGFADIAIGQKGWIPNLAISTVTYSSLPEFITGEYANFIKELTLKAESKGEEDGSNGSLMDILENAAREFISVPRKLLDFLGNLDLLINPDKLERLSLVHNALQDYEGIDSNEEKFNMGLDAELGTSYDNFLKGMMKNDASVLDADNFIDTVNPLSEYSLFLKEKHSLLETLEYVEEDEEDSFDEHVVMGVSAPLGKKSDGTVETESERQQRIEKSNIYTEHVRNIQNWKLSTKGRLK